MSYEPVARAYLKWVVQNRGAIDGTALREIWPLVVGTGLAKWTRPERMIRRQLEVSVPDSIWMQELTYQRTAILSRLNRLLPQGVQTVQGLRLQVEPRLSVVPARGEREEEEAGELSSEQQAEVAGIPDESLRSLVERVITRTRAKKRQKRGDSSDKIS